MLSRYARQIATAALTAGLAISTASTGHAASLVGTYKDWSLFKHEEASKQICFAASQPKQMSPDGANRDSVFFYVSAWPKDGVKSEVSVRLGYPIQSGSTVKVEIGGQSFDLFAKDDKAFVADPTEELKLIEAMRRGNVMNVAATSTRGTATTDSYSLSGVTAALNDLAKECN